MNGNPVEWYQYWRYRRRMEFRRYLPRVLFALTTIAAIAVNIALAAMVN